MRMVWRVGPGASYGYKVDVGFYRPALTLFNCFSRKQGPAKRKECRRIWSSLPTARLLDVRNRHTVSELYVQDSDAGEED